MWYIFAILTGFFVLEISAGDFSHLESMVGTNRFPESWLIRHKHIDDATINQLLKDININAQDDRGQTLLYRAIIHEAHSIMSLLLKTPGIDLSIKDSLGRTILLWAIMFGKNRAIRLLLAAPHLDLNAQDESGMAALHWASKAGRADVTSYLLAKPKINVNIRNQQLKTPLHEAVKAGQIAVIILLLNNTNVDVNAQDKYGWTPLHIASSDGNLDIIQFLLDTPNIDIHRKTNGECSVCDLAVESGYTDIALFLMFAMAKSPITQLKSSLELTDMTITNRNGDTPLHRAFDHNMSNLALAILQHADQDPRALFDTVNIYGQRPLELLDPKSPLFIVCMNLAFADTILEETEAVRPDKFNTQCAFCTKPESIHRCANCKEVYYCSPSCQTMHWKLHKKNCTRNPLS